ncbi:calcium-binding protein [Streptomyces sp. AN091965]|uniref:calcium-binding protein n=1 Tax=Streptomyces sp. AN091965 TaxID=2927803 RepID=UPI001F6080F5|nr:calcium-binding protein [Streptomyces sp. AN091965]MCI3931427.1 calcium-binding protein [Streptomyces sp. AN091965]
MRIRATVAAVSGALALSVLLAPAAQAAGPDFPVPLKDAQKGDTKITKAVVNGGKDIVVGTTAKKKFTIAVTATDAKGVAGGGGLLWHGRKFDEQNLSGVLNPTADEKCKKLSATSATCTVTITVNPKASWDKNGLANHMAGGGWKLFAAAGGTDDDYVIRTAYKTGIHLKRAAKLTVNASPEPVKKGKTITVAGALTRANWDTGRYAGYTQQPVKLQFKKKGASAYTTLKTVKSDAKGNLKTTVKASADGTFRYVFAGTSTTPAVTSAGDAIDVR